MYDNRFFYIAIFIAIILVIYVLREIFTWYWKQTRIVELLEQINNKLDDINKRGA